MGFSDADTDESAPLSSGLFYNIPGFRARRTSSFQKYRIVTQMANKAARRAKIRETKTKEHKKEEESTGKKKKREKHHNPPQYLSGSLKVNGTDRDVV